jgi:hypothetical protein
MMHTEIYCDTLPALDTVAAIRAIHQAYLQLFAVSGLVRSEGYDNGPSLAALSECLAAAGHPGFTAEGRTNA